MFIHTLLCGESVLYVNIICTNTFINFTISKKPLLHTSIKNFNET